MSNISNSTCSVQITLKKIEAIAKINSEIIDRICSASSPTCVLSVTQQDKGYTFQVAPQQKMSEFLQSWKKTIELIQVPNIFNEKINFQCSTFGDLVRLNGEMLKVASKFAMFGENDTSRECLLKYLQNFELIQTGLGEIEGRTIGSKSLLEDFNKEVEKLNSIIKSLCENPNITLQQPFNTTFLSENQQRQLYEWTGKSVWKLLYRASRDGYKANDFHSRCDNMGPTLTVIKSSNGYLFGGYSPQSWSATVNDYITDTTNTAFIFSLTNPANRPPTKYRLIQSEYSIYSAANNGPTFGGVHDIGVVTNGNTNTTNCTIFPYSYEDTTGAGSHTFTGSVKFRVSDIEVFGL